MPDDRRDGGEREETRDRPHLGNLRERLEALRRIPVEDAIGLLRVYLQLAFREGEIDGRDDECQCIARILRAENCCRRRREDEDERDEDWGDGDRRGRRRDDLR